MSYSGADPGFQVRGEHLKKLRRAEGGANIFGVFRVKNHDYTPKNHIFTNCGGRRENFWGISCEKSRFYAKKSYFFPILGGGRPPGSSPVIYLSLRLVMSNTYHVVFMFCLSLSYVSYVANFSFFFGQFLNVPSVFFNVYPIQIQMMSDQICLLEKIEKIR